MESRGGGGMDTSVVLAGVSDCIDDSINPSREFSKYSIRLRKSIFHLSILQTFNLCMVFLFKKN